MSMGMNAANTGTHVGHVSYGSDDNMMVYDDDNTPVPDVSITPVMPANKISVPMVMRRTPSTTGKHHCVPCQKSFAIAISLKWHRLAVHTNIRFQCDMCGKLCKYYSNLLMHKKAAHAEETKRSSEGEGSYLCSECRCLLTTQNQLLTHVKEHHADIACLTSQGGPAIENQQDASMYDDQQPLYYDQHMMPGSYTNNHASASAGMFPPLPHQGMLQSPGADMPAFMCANCQNHFDSEVSLYLHVQECQEQPPPHVNVDSGAQRSPKPDKPPSPGKKRRRSSSNSRSPKLKIKWKIPPKIKDRDSTASHKSDTDDDFDIDMDPVNNVHMTLTPDVSLGKIGGGGGRVANTDGQDSEFPCHLCERGHSEFWALQTHLLGNHGGISWYQCDICDTKVNFYSNLWSHKKNGHKLKGNEVSGGGGDSSNKSFLCTLCKEKFHSSGRAFVVHLATKHPQESGHLILEKPPRRSHKSHTTKPLMPSQFHQQQPQQKPTQAQPVVNFVTDIDIDDICDSFPDGSDEEPLMPWEIPTVTIRTKPVMPSSPPKEQPLPSPKNVPSKRDKSPPKKNEQQIAANVKIVNRSNNSKGKLKVGQFVKVGKGPVCVKKPSSPQKVSPKAVSNPTRQQIERTTKAVKKTQPIPVATRKTTRVSKRTEKAAAAPPRVSPKSQPKVTRNAKKTKTPPAKSKQVGEAVCHKCDQNFHTTGAAFKQHVRLCRVKPGSRD